MASPGSLLFSLCLISLLNTFITANSLQTPNTLCPSFTCGNGFSISYPFWHNQDQQLLERCGYPGFNVSCNDRNPVLHLSNNTYQIRTINYSHKSLLISHFEAKHVTCPSLYQNFTLPAFSLFNYSTSHNRMLRFFYNCTLFPPSIPSIVCLRYSAKNSYVFTEGAIPEFDWNTYCDSTVTVPVIERAVNGVSSNGFVGALQEGFELTWQQPADVACRSCEATGGFCGYSNDQLHEKFFCHCPDGKHSTSCADNGEISIKFGPNYPAIGALLFGSLIMAATAFYFIQKKRVALYKPVSQ
ncbi:hypothetical protein PTKIN_Ptkin09bG0008600 [Pterospermum kingtungense]